MPGTLRVHSLSPVSALVATIRPEWPTANTTPSLITGVAASRKEANCEMARVRDRFSDQRADPSVTFKATRSPEGYGTATISPSTAGADVHDQACFLGQSTNHPNLATVSSIEAIKAPFHTNDEQPASRRRRRSPNGRAEIFFPQHLPPLPDRKPQPGRNRSPRKAGRFSAARPPPNPPRALDENVICEMKPVPALRSLSGTIEARQMADPPEEEKALT